MENEKAVDVGRKETYCLCGRGVPQKWRSEDCAAAAIKTLISSYACSLMDNCRNAQETNLYFVSRYAKCI